ncbi:5-oxoprolinase subunit C family protein [Cognatilysobacter tabacisoli]|uniref:5-oxoprolinase subunit C family protein n=1 Tax=Cognatilysobacter tabacisoli TaxID=2315424 RepID=UPI0018C8BAA3|nr:biotin-dependent carboxyltransferase family protein [Lysobacter tabacisoli]
MSLRVLAAGPLTTVQDLGRHGWRHLGVAQAGALDPDAAALANRLVGNAAGDAVLEFTLHGPTLAIDRTSRVAICGADVDAAFRPAGGETIALATRRPIALPPGELMLGPVRGGARAWLAIDGGIDVPVVLDSRSTDLRGGFGGCNGRALQRGDELPLGTARQHDATAVQLPAWWVDPDADEPREAPIRYVASLHPASGALARGAWRVDARSNRQGLRLAGTALAADAPDGVSAPVAPGTVQLPPDGQPIVLLADAQTVGGYPRLGHVASADLPRLAQCRPGDALRFTPIDADAAHALLLARRHRHARAALAAAQRSR